MAAERRPRRPRPAPREGAPPTEELLRIESIAAGGDGVARAVDGIVVFVPRTAPADLVRARVRRGRRMARGEPVEIVEPGPRRLEPPCAHYVRDRCGGCQLQHLEYEAQLAVKGVVIRDAIARIARRPLPGGAEPSVEPSPRRWRYRRKLTLALRRRRGGAWYAGLHPYDDPVAVFAVEDCPITDERVVGAWREVVAAGELLPDEAALRGAVRLDEAGCTLVIEGGSAWPEGEALLARCPSLSAVWWVPEGGARRLLHRRGGEDAPGATFAQVNGEVAALLGAHVVRLAEARRPATVVDCYAGLGDTAVALAERGARVTAIELDPDAAAWCAGRLPEGSRSVAARVEDALPEALPADVVVLNPPRAGVDERVTAALEGARPRPRAVIYVSCDPATLARDLARLPGWRIASMQAFDMFPQTAHVETVCELVPEEG